MPTSRTINSMLTSQYKDVQTEVLVFGKRIWVSAFLEDYFGSHHDGLTVAAIVLAVFPIAYSSLYAYFIGKLNFQNSIKLVICKYCIHTQQVYHNFNLVSWSYKYWIMTLKILLFKPTETSPEEFCSIRFSISQFYVS